MGRLIDADAMIDKYGEWYTEEWTEEGFIGTLEGVVYMMPTVEAIPVDYLNSRISRLRQYQTYAGDFGADFLEAVIKDYNKEAHND